LPLSHLDWGKDARSLNDQIPQLHRVRTALLSWSCDIGLELRRRSLSRSSRRHSGRGPAADQLPRVALTQHYHQRQYVSATIGRGKGQNGFQVGCGVNFK
jgi:hypothetical protein